MSMGDIIFLTTLLFAVLGALALSVVDTDRARLGVIGIVAIGIVIALACITGQPIISLRL